MIMEPSSNDEFAKRFIDVSKDVDNYLISSYQYYDKSITINSIVSDIVNYDTRYLIDQLNDMKDDMNKQYEEEYPDCASIIHEIELLIMYLE